MIEKSTVRERWKEFLYKNEKILKFNGIFSFSVLLKRTFCIMDWRVYVKSKQKLKIAYRKKF